jgi:hypothetical protein
VSIKELFNKKSISVSSRPKNSSDFVEIESYKLVEEKEQERVRFVPEIDYDVPSQFAFYGSAQKYYLDSFEQIYKTYPYDGSFYEKTKWHNESSDLVNYIFENAYPRKNGYANIGFSYGTSTTSDDGYSDTSIPEYIQFSGTLNLGNKYEPDNNRTYNLKTDGETGVTLEFYLKKDDLLGSDKQVVFDLWNNEATGSDSYGRFKVEIHPGIAGQEDKFFVDISSGSSGVVGASIGNGLNFTGSWNHYAIAFVNTGSQINLQLFVNGDLHSQTLTGSDISMIKGAIHGNIGSLVTAASGTNSAKGWGKLSGSLDEIRFWKTKRTDKQISTNYFLQIAGGTNTDNANTDLGLYYKFNEGIYSTSSVSQFDQNVLDYSGRISNGLWVGYSLGSRNTGSAIVESGVASVEFADPIVYSTNPEVLSKKEEYSNKGYEYDLENNASSYNTLPGWIIEKDQESGETTKELLQIVSEYFDELYNKIKFLPTIKHNIYNQDKPLPFMVKLLQNSGFEAIDIFNDVSTIEYFLNRNESETYDEKIYNLKNFIYQNIYNNLLYLYKSKGTEKSIRNLIHCFGVDEELIKINLYSDNQEFLLEDEHKFSTQKVKTLNLNNTSSFGGSVYQKLDSSDASSLGFLTGSNSIKTIGSTTEVQVLFPNKFSQEDSFFFETPFITSSVFGLHESTDGTWTTNDSGSVQVFAVREDYESDNVYFQLSSSHFGLNLTSSVFRDVYSEDRWNLALRIKPEKYPLADYVEGSDVGDYVIELYGTNYLQDVKENSFIISSSVSSTLVEQFYEAEKMLYIGAHRQNFSGSVVSTDGSIVGQQKSDLEFVYVRHWNSYLDDYSIDLHAKDITNYGANDENYKIAVQQYYIKNELSQLDRYSPQNNSLALHWQFDNLTASNGSFTVKDFSSGSISDQYADLFSPYCENKLTGYGENVTTDSSRVFNTRYFNTAKLQQPEVVNSDNFISILQQDDEFFTRNSKPVNHYFMLEKSMYGIISQEMLSWLGTAKEFNNLIGRPEYRYEENYSELKQLKHIFFRRVENEPDFDRFKSFYKWLDNSISLMVEQFIPASTNYSKNVFDIVESHVLERNKYRHKLPTIEFNSNEPIGIVHGVGELRYNWTLNHAPLTGLERNNCNWWKERAERTGTLNPERDGVHQVLLSSFNRRLNNPYKIGIQLEISGTLASQKKRELDIIINDVVGTGLSFDIPDWLSANSDCED